MITRAIIKEKGSNDYLWKVHIPLLDGKPDSIEEKSKFDAYYANQSQVQTNSDEVKNKFQKDFQGAQSSAQVNKDKTTPDYDKQYLREAHVCGIPNSIIHYQEGDVVIVGFEDNNMGKPIILGSLLTKELEDQTVTKVSINAHTLTADEVVTLPLSSNVLFKRSDEPQTNELTQMSATDIEKVVTFINVLIEGNVGANILIDMLERITALTNRFNSLFPSTDSTSKENKTEEGKSE